MQRLLKRFPAFKHGWPQEIQIAWFQSFSHLCDAVGNGGKAGPQIIEEGLAQLVGPEEPESPEPRPTSRVPAKRRHGKLPSHKSKAMDLSNPFQDLDCLLDGRPQIVVAECVRFQAKWRLDEDANLDMASISLRPCRGCANWMSRIVDLQEAVAKFNKDGEE